MLFINQYTKNNNKICNSKPHLFFIHQTYLSRIIRKQPRTAKVQASLRICAGQPEPSMFGHISCRPRESFIQKIKFLDALGLSMRTGTWTVRTVRIDLFLHHCTFVNNESISNPGILDFLYFHRYPKVDNLKCNLKVKANEIYIFIWCNLSE